MKYYICEPRKFEVLKAFDYEVDADKWAIRQLPEGWGVLSCIFSDVPARYFSECRANKTYRLKAGKPCVETINRTPVKTF